MISMMRIRIDEAGDFNYHDETRLSISVVAGIVIPDQSWDAVEQFVRARQSDWDMTELKAGEMDDAQLMEVAELVIAENLTVAASATDSHIFTADSQALWRERQLAVVTAAAARSRRAVEDKQVAERVARVQRRTRTERHIKQPNYLQYGILMPWLVSHLLSTSLLVYRTMAPENDSWLMDIVIDERPGADPGKAGDLLRDSVEAIFASDDRTALRMPSEWPSNHPFKIKNTDPEVDTISVRQVLSGGINPGVSHDDAGLQLADYVAHLVFALLRDPNDQGAQRAWRALVRAPRVMPMQDGRLIRVMAWPGEHMTEADKLRYERLVPART